MENHCLAEIQNCFMNDHCANATKNFVNECDNMYNGDIELCVNTLLITDIYILTLCESNNECLNQFKFLKDCAVL
eukprot:UN10435